MRFTLIIILCLLNSAGLYAADLPTESAGAANLASSPALKQAHSSKKPPIFEMEDSGCGGEDLFKDTRCTAKYLQWLDVQLNDAYKHALDKLPEHDDTDTRREREQLRKSQRAWLKYKDENCTLIGGLSGGSNPNVTYLSLLCEEKELKQRIQFLNRIANDEDL